MTLKTGGLVGSVPDLPLHTNIRSCPYTCVRRLGDETETLDMGHQMKTEGLRERLCYEE